MTEARTRLDPATVFGGKDSSTSCVKVPRVPVFIKTGLLNSFSTPSGCKENDRDINNILIIHSDVLYL